MTFSYDDALNASIEYFSGEDLPARVFVDKYALRNINDELVEKTPDDMHRRLAREFARIEKNKFKEPYSEEYIYSLFKNYSTIIPQGSPIYGIGNQDQYVSISNCVVVDSPEDSYGGILKTDQELVQLSKRRCGVGLDLSKLRPTKSRTRNSARSSTGTLSWMNRYSNSIREVGQDGRRGALMLTINVHHPDVLLFASAKDNDTAVTGANISVRLTDEFLEAVEKDTEYEQRWPVDSKTPTITKMVRAKDVWNKLIQNAHSRAEPGLLFWDNIIKESIPDCYPGYTTIATNPCGEIPLSAYDSCRLLVLNLMRFVNNPFTANATFDFNEFYKLSQIAQRLMDDMIDLELECIDRIIRKINGDPEKKEIKRTESLLWQCLRKTCEEGRRTGLGCTALGDAIAACGLKYGSEDSISFVDRVYKTLKFGSYRSSVDMAKELGPFPIWDWSKEKDCPFLTRLIDEDIEIGTTIVDGIKTSGYIWGEDLYDDIRKYGRRNIANLTSAPTGTISTQAGYQVGNKWYFGSTSGIEPLFDDEAFSRMKKIVPGDKDARTDFVDKNGDHWMKFEVYHPGIKAWRECLDGIIGDNPYHNATANTIVWTQRVKLQAAAQRHIDHSISSTVNLPEHTPVEEVAKIYETAWKSGCKGITVYRDKCRSGVLIHKQEEEVIKERPKELPCDVHHITVKGKQYFVLVGLGENGKPYEVFAGKNGFIDKEIKHGKIIKQKRGLYKVIFEDETDLSPITASSDEHEETITRLTSALLRTGADIIIVVQQLEKVNGEMLGFSKALARALKKYIKDGTVEQGEECPSCKQKTLIRVSGCVQCNCGWSKCS
jgi:ribonucleoside-diphosphate reductase alpha chain